jgi:gliding motility-associated-like protein
LTKYNELYIKVARIKGPYAIITKINYILVYSKMKRKILHILFAALLPLAGINAQEIIIDSVTTTPVSCNSFSDGTITVYISGAIGEITYTLITRPGFLVVEQGVTRDSFYTFSGHPSDGYQFFVDDSVGSSADQIVSIGSPDPIQIQSVNTSDQTCSYLVNGTITVNATGEGGNLHYQLTDQLTGTVTDDNTDGQFTDLSEGTYRVDVTDLDGCPSSDNFPDIVIGSPAPITINLDNNIPVTCYNGNNGAIEITPGGGTPSGSGTGYTYSWTGPNGYTASTEDISNLRAGEYTVTVTDENGCYEPAGPFTVLQPSEITASNVTVIDVDCNGESDGAISFDPGGGTPPYSFAWSGQVSGSTSTDEDPSGLVADTYDLTITDDAPGCSKTFTGIAVVSEPDPIAVTVASINHVRCFGESNGSAEIDVTGGTPPHDFEWTAASGPYSSDEKDPTGMPADTYTLTIVDGNGCPPQTFTNILTITEPDDIIITLDGWTDVSCSGGADGSAQVTVSNGTPGYSYLWTGTGTGHTSMDEDPVDLIKDTYDLDITDANGCPKKSSGIVTIDQPTEISVTESITHIECYGKNTGAIEITPSGGIAPYSFSWSGPDGYTANTEDISNLRAGDYTVTVTDENECNVSPDPFTVGQASEITVPSPTITHVECNGGSNGAISITPAGGTPPYTYEWSGQTSGPVAGDENISGLSADTYSLTITDDAGCFKLFEDIAVVSEPDPLSASFIPTDARCYGYDDGKINVNVTGGTPGYDFEWSSTGGFFSTDEDLTGLAPDDYSLTVRDVNGCSETYNNITIDEPTEISITANPTNISCNGYDDGSIEINTTGGTPGYSYDWDGPNGFTSEDQNISSLEPGTYNLTVTDNNGCPKPFNNVATLTEPDGIVVTFSSQTNLDCNGANSGAIEIDVTGGTPPYAFSWTNSQGTIVSVDEDPKGLPADTYSLQVTANGTCTVNYPDAVELTEPEELTTTLAKTDITCYGLKNGTITVTPSGGTPPYKHRLSSTDYSDENIFTNLKKGLYMVYTQDANECFTYDTITINEPNQINYKSDYEGDIICNGDSVIIVINDVTGGIAPFQYSIDDGATYQSSSQFPNQTAGSYDLVVKDANLCEQKSSFSFNEPDSIVIDDFSKTDVSTCYDAANGSIFIGGDGGTGNINYSLNGGTPKLLGVFDNLLGGTYTVSLIDKNSCQKDTIVEILRPDQLVFEKADVTDVTGCPGDNTGEIDANVNGGTGVKEYSIDGSTWQPTGLFTLLTAGDYTIMVRDANGCKEDTTVSVSEPLPISIISETTTPASCFGTSTGAVTVEAAGGTLPYTYSLTPPLLPDQSAGTFSGLPAGDYTVTVTDAEGCATVPSSTLTVTDPPELIVDSVKTEHITCFGSSDGKIDIYVDGGSSPYEYSIDDEATWEANASFTGLGPGTYEVYAQDVNGCSVNAGSFIITEPLVALGVTAVVTDVSPCFGDTTGTISATASGGWNSYEYSIDGLNYQLSGDFNDLAAGDYTIYVRDAGNCIVTLDKTITEPEQVTAVINKTDYVDDVLGTITISDASGGTPPYEYSIDEITGTFSANTSYTENLTAGFYYVVVKDALGCLYKDTIQIFDIIPLEMVIDSTEVTCYGYDDGTILFQPQDAVGIVRYSIDDGATYTTEPLFENLPGDSTYLLHAFDQEDKQFSGSVYIAEPDELFVSTDSIVRAKCNAFSETGSAYITVTGGTGTKTFSWSDGSTGEDLSNVEAGQYTVTITDEAGCSSEESLFIRSRVPPVNVNAGEDTTVCAGATIALDGTQAADHNMQWEPQTFLSNVNIPDPFVTEITESITYTYTLQETTSGFGCYNIDTLHIEVLPVYGLEITPDTFGLQGTTVQLEVLNTGEYVSYEWIPETGLSMSTVADPLVTLQNTIRYWLQATNDFGCVETDSVFIEVIEDIEIYNVFSPNGDQINDYFEIENAYKFPDIIVEVYNRWGGRIFSSVGYSDEKRWDGTFNGKDVPTGTYYYVVIPHPEAKPVTGNVTIIR